MCVDRWHSTNVIRPPHSGKYPAATASGVGCVHNIEFNEHLFLMDDAGLATLKHPYAFFGIVGWYLGTRHIFPTFTSLDGGDKPHVRACVHTYTR